MSNHGARIAVDVKTRFDTVEGRRQRCQLGARRRGHNSSSIQHDVRSFVLLPVLQRPPLLLLLTLALTLALVLPTTHLDRHTPQTTTPYIVGPV